MNLPKLTILLAVLALASCNKQIVEPLPEKEQVKPAQNSKPEPLAEDPFLKDVDAAQASDLLQRPVVILDVRTPEEFAAGHIDGAINVDFKNANFKDELGKLDKEKTYLMHCRSGGRSSAAKPAFTELGFKFIYHLDGGMIAWEKAGLPTVK